MSIFLAFLAVLFLGVAVYALIMNKRLEEALRRTQQDAQLSVNQAQQESQRAKQFYESETQRVYGEAQTAVGAAQRQLDQQFAEVKLESEHIRHHYETEARKSQEAAEALLAKTLKELEPLRKYESLKNAEDDTKKNIVTALEEVASLRKEAEALISQLKIAADDELASIREKAKDIQEQADARLNQALKDAGRIVAEAEKRAQQIGGDAYEALRTKEMLERAAQAMRNVIEGYGDRYLVPAHSILDDLAVEFGRTAAAQAFASARAQTKRMIEQREAATCDYVEANRRETAIQFVIHAFNGSVDTALTRIKSDNYGILEQKVKDAYSIVNRDGSAFRDARILPAFLDARLAELKWGTTLFELNRQWQEEQRSRREELRAAQKDAEEILKRQREAARETELKKTAVQEAEQRHKEEIDQLKAKHEKELEEAGRSGLAAVDEALKRHTEEVNKLNGDWRQQLEAKERELEEAKKRELTAAQLGRAGHVYVISNIGSFNYGEEDPTIFKIGMTRRPEPDERIGELSNASVPFAFDIHALIKSDNAPALETRLHHEFRDHQVNKNNFRKEFFRVTLQQIREAVERIKNEGLSFDITKDWIAKAPALDFYLSRQIENDPGKMAGWRIEQARRASRLAREARGSFTPDQDPDDTNEQLTI
jgi:hypothetical protein